MTTINLNQKLQKDLSIPKYHRRVMVFDTETSGLMPKHKFGTPFPPMEEYPHIMQFSWIVYNVSSNLIEEIVDEYVQIPDSAPISPESTKVNGITREMTKEKGKQITPLLLKFFAAYMKCDCIVAHNLRFDGEMVRKEMWRNRKDLEKFVNKDRVNLMCGVFTAKYNAAYYIDTFCTMMNTIQFCGIDWVPKPKESLPTEPTEPKESLPTEPKDGLSTEPTEPKDGLSTEPKESLPTTEPLETLGGIVDSSLNPVLEEAVSEATVSETVSEAIEQKTSTPNNRKKFPRLDELYGKLFDTPLPKEMHNSIVDVLVCLRCFLKVRGAKVMSEEEFLGLVQKHTSG